MSEYDQAYIMIESMTIPCLGIEPGDGNHNELIELADKIGYKHKSLIKALINIGDGYHIDLAGILLGRHIVEKAKDGS